MPTNTKRCRDCDERKPFSAFNKCKGGSHGLQAYCRVCQSGRRKNTAAPAPIVVKGAKVCSSCGGEKPVTEFPLSYDGYGDGRRGQCRSCRNAQRSALYRPVDRRSNPNDVGRDDAKRCSSCLLTFELDDFAPSKLGFLGRNSRCRPCHRAVGREYKARVGKMEKVIPATKSCTKCGAEKAAKKFNRYRYSLDGLFHYCRTCEDNKLAAYRARKASATVEDVDRAVVWARDGGRCHICGKVCNQDKWHLDHIVPLSRGGEHSYRNVAVSHPFCNISKGARGQGQLRLGMMTDAH